MSKEFKPYISDEKNHKEVTGVSMVTGILLAVVFGAANAYLGLRVGMTISASVPAAVISMCIIRKILKRKSILENNMVQTIGSAGESLAGGAIFTFPALFLWAKEGQMEAPGMIEITLVAIIGGILGALFMVPMRKTLIVDEHGVLPYPEGTACAEVLIAGEESSSSSKSIFIGMGFAALVKFILSGLKIAVGTISLPIKALKSEIACEISPSIVAVGYICGAKIAASMFGGGILAWFVLIPAIVTFGADTVIFPGTETISAIYEAGGAAAIWSNYIRYIGAGAVATAGVISLCKSFPTIIKTFSEAVKGLKNSKNASGKSVPRTERNLDIRVIIIGIVLMILLAWLLPNIPISLPSAIIIAVLGFFFGAVSSRMVGLVGSSNSPVSGMAIATLLIATSLLKLFGDNGAHGMKAAIIIGSIICIVAAMAGDTSQDLKTGYLVGATPRNQQIGEIVGAIAAALAIGGVMVLLDKAWGFGSQELAAPQATLMKVIVEGIMDGNLPWGLIGIGAFISLAVELLGVSSLAVAIGLYLPIEITASTMLGGIIRLIVDKKKAKAEDSDEGILFCSGIIAGEGLVGILMAVLAVTHIDKIIDLSGTINTGIYGGFVILAIIIALIMKYGFKKSTE